MGGSLPARWGGSMGVTGGIGALTPGALTPGALTVGALTVGALGGALGGGECLHCGHWVSCESHDAHHLAEQHL